MRTRVGLLGARRGRGSARPPRARVPQSGISEHLILKWVNHADLFRIHGVAAEYAELLEASGVDTVPELAQRNAAHLQSKMAEANEEKKLVRRVLAESEVEEWVTEAKGLQRRVDY